MEAQVWRSLAGWMAIVSFPCLAQTSPVTIRVDASANKHPISPYIYGVAHATQAQLNELNAPLNRNGGNATSRYNWQLNATNRGKDWYFQSLPYTSAQPGAEVDQFITNARGAGAQPLLTVPIMGWVAKLGLARTRLSSFSILKYGSQLDRDYQWFPDAGNGVYYSGQFVTNDPNDANQPSSVSFQQGWVNHLLGRWGPSAQGGVRFYSLDNEPSIWHLNHRDVHPTGATMDEVRDKHLDFASMVKSQDPNALTFGPEEWGWDGYFHSGYDQQYLSTHGAGWAPDRQNHGGMDYLPWLLDQFRQRDQATGKRLLDVFTVHYYPQGGEFSADTSTTMQQLRNRSTRSLWDPNYMEESWIKDRVSLIPRLKGWVQTYYPGTQIGITEYNWGAETHINGAIAQADILGIFGREGLDYGIRWQTPEAATPTFKAMKLYRNYDGQKSAFGDTSVSCGVPDPDQLSAFAAERSSDGALTVMVLNKALTDTPITLNLAGFKPAATAQRWQLTASNAIVRLADLTVSSTGLSASVPAQSITLLVLPKGAAINQPPVSRILATPTSGTIPLPVVLDGTTSSDADGTIVSYAWNFGDGQQGTGPQQSHTYTQAGTYTVTLTVTDSDGASASSTATITASTNPNPNPNPSLAAPSGFYTQASGSSITLRWTDTSSAEEGFILERALDSWPLQFVEVGRVGANVTIFVDNGLAPGTYAYRARAFLGTEVSSYSNQDSSQVR
ncbi:glycoside hydrolase family 44 protein [Melittangium boletus]|uniref:Cellulase n=1 Tax=Melittangium boletus DSM 14713 TaxID=1294270 RepID=A0A286NVB5_9BACT|nr:glycoside hydrolase family 44 protein [Melittangium boletus]ATB27058.1 cellulase [Melittangium boletus DSM 14713]